MIESRRIMLLLTENCNLNCLYCYEHEKSNKEMSFSIAKNILDDNLKNISNNNIIIELFGGEAFLNFNLIKKIYVYLKESYSHLDIKYETTTNGTVVHGEIKKWLYEHRNDFFISVSLDGNETMHNSNRKFVNGKGTFDAIDIDFFSQTWPGCPAKMTISDRTLPYASEGIIYLEDKGFKCDATLAIGTDWDQENIFLLSQELCKLVDYYLHHPNRQLCTMLNMDFRLIFTPIDDDYRFCGAGIDMVCYDTQGNQYPCQGFAPVSIGEKSNLFLEFDNRNFRFTHENRCKSCKWVRLCPNCYAANFQSMSDIQKVDPNLCKLYKLCILASAKIQCMRILSKKVKTHDDQLILKAVSVVQKEMRI